LLLEQLAHQPQRRPAVASALNQHVEDLALVVDGAPKIHPLASDPHHHLCPNAIGRSAEGDADAAVERSRDRILVPGR